MQRITKEWLEFLREQYPEGSRIQLKEMLSFHRYHCPGTVPLPVYGAAGDPGSPGEGIPGNPAAVAAKRRKKAVCCSG